jgi:hypothetical protein
VRNQSFIPVKNSHLLMTRATRNSPQSRLHLPMMSDDGAVAAEVTTRDWGIGKLPDEVLVLLLTFCDATTLARVSACARWMYHAGPHTPIKRVSRSTNSTPLAHALLDMLIRTSNTPRRMVLQGCSCLVKQRWIERVLDEIRLFKRVGLQDVPFTLSIAPRIAPLFLRFWSLETGDVALIKHSVYYDCQRLAELITTELMRAQHPLPHLQHPKTALDMARRVMIIRGDLIPDLVGCTGLFLGETEAFYTNNAESEPNHLAIIQLDHHALGIVAVASDAFVPLSLRFLEQLEGELHVAYQKVVRHTLQACDAFGHRTSTAFGAHSINDFITLCFMPRILLSPDDAELSVRFVKLLHERQCEGFSTLRFYNEILSQYSGTFALLPVHLAGLSKSHAAHLGLGLGDLLAKVLHWTSNHSTYARECAAKLGFATTPSRMSARRATYDEFLSLVCWWYSSIYSALLQAVEGLHSTVVQRNTLIAMRQIIPLLGVKRDLNLRLDEKLERYTMVDGPLDMEQEEVRNLAIALKREFREQCTLFESESVYSSPVDWDAQFLIATPDHLWALTHAFM